MWFFFFNDTATTEIYTLSLHDALPISARPRRLCTLMRRRSRGCRPTARSIVPRSEEHTSELQSRLHLVCRLLLEKKKITNSNSALCDSNTLGADHGYDSPPPRHRHAAC